MEPRRSSRVYAITMKHKLITRCFIVAIVFQFGLGVFMTYEAITGKGMSSSFRLHSRPAVM